MRQDGEVELMSSRRCRQRHLTVHFNVSLRLIVALPPLVTLLNFSFFLLLALVSLFVALSIYESLTGAEWVEHLFDLFFSLSLLPPRGEPLTVKIKTFRYSKPFFDARCNREQFTTATDFFLLSLRPRSCVKKTRDNDKVCPCGQRS
jgi:hypothetical protein